MSPACLHVSQLNNIKAPAAFSKIFKEECTLCFVTPDSEGGLNVCLTCFNGGCTAVDGAPDHCTLHYRKTGHCLVLNVKRSKKPATTAAEGEQPAKLSKVEVKEAEEPSFDYDYFVSCLACSASWSVDSDAAASEPIGEAGISCVQAIISSTSASKKLEAQAWQEEVVTCEHSKSLAQSFDPITCQVQSKERCSLCDLSENLWMCLTCGYIGCGRRQFDGSGGNGHGMEHFKAHKHPLAIKLGTITAEGDGDVYCYICNEMRLDTRLAEHLTALGIDVAAVEARTERTMAELQLEQNLKLDFSMVSEDGRELVAVGGSGRIGLKNLGNSCYFNSVIQSLFHLPIFQQAYGVDRVMDSHLKNCHKDTSACFVCQAGKVQRAMIKGVTSVAISPWMFKAVVTNGHPEFSTARQQDASEFLSYLLKVVQRSDPSSKGQAKEIIAQFTFTQQQRLVCSSCGDCRYQRSSSTQLSLQLSDVLNSPHDCNVTLQDRLELSQFLGRYFEEEPLEGVRCSKCGGTGGKSRSMSLLSFPKYLVVTLSRYIVRNWVPQKFDMAVAMPFDNLDLSTWRGEEAPATASSTSAEEDDAGSIDQATLAELVSMGFPISKCRKAIKATGSSGVEAAMNWIFEHEQDANIDSADGGLVQTLVDAGFEREQSVRALEATDGNIERAFDWILNHPHDESAHSQTVPQPSPSGSTSNSEYRLCSFISHKGPSVHCGHYIAHVRHQGEWIMFNDERVVLAHPQPPHAAAERAYIFIYERID